MAKQLKFSAVLELAADQFRNASKAASAQFSADQKTMAASTETVRQKLAEIRAEANKSFASTGLAGLSKQVAEVNERSTAATAQMRNAQSQFVATGASAREGATGVGVLGGELTKLAGVGLSLAAVTAGVKSIIDVTVQLQKVGNALASVTGGTLQASTALATINKTADELGLRATSLTKDFTQLAAATRGTQLEGAETERLFKAVAAASATLGLGAGEVSRAFTALQQIISKGVVSQEELRGQLAEAIPGATQIAARAFGVTTEELGKMVEAGLPAEEFVRKFSTQLATEFPNAAANAGTLGGSISALANEFDRLQQTLGQNFVGAALITLVKDLEQTLKNARLALAAFGSTPEFDALKASVETAYATFKELARVVAESLGAALSNIGSLITGVSAELRGVGDEAASASAGFDVFRTTLDGVTVTLGFITDGITALGIVFNGLAGTAALVASGIVGAFGAVKEFFTGTLDPSIESTQLRLADMASVLSDKVKTSLDGFSSAGVAALDRVTAASQRLAEARLAPAVEDDLKRIENRAKAVASATLEAAQQIVKIGADAKTSLKQDIGTELDEAIKKFEALGRKADASGRDIVKAFGEAAQKVSDSTQFDAVKAAYEKLVQSGKLSAQQQAEAFRIVQDAAIKTGATIEGAVGESLKRLGVATKDQLKAQLAQVEADIQRVRSLASSGAISGPELQKAEALAAKTSQDLRTQIAGGTLDKQKSTQADKERAEAADLAKEAEARASAAAAAAAVEQKKKADALAEATRQANSQSAALGQLSNAFNSYKTELEGLSAAAANQFVSNLGGDFQVAKEKITDTAGALAQVREELAASSTANIGSLGGVNKAFQDLYNSSLQVKEEFFQQKIEFEGAVGALAEATSSSTSSIADLENAIRGANRDFDLLNGSDLSALNAAVDSARNKIVQLQEQARDTAASLADMGKTLTQELLRAQGNEVDAIRIEYEKRRSALEKQASQFASDPSVVAEVEKNKALLAQLEQIALKKQQQRDADDRANEATRQIQKLNPANDPNISKRSQEAPTVETARTDATRPKQVIQFTAPDGTTAEGTFDAEEGASKVVDVLRKSGASSLSRSAA